MLNSVSANLRGARQRAGLSLEQLARRSELHPVGVKRVEDGATMPRLDTLVKLAGALEVPPAELCAGVAWDVERQRFDSSGRRLGPTYSGAASTVTNPRTIALNSAIAPWVMGTRKGLGGSRFSPAPRQRGRNLRLPRSARWDRRRRAFLVKHRPFP